MSIPPDILFRRGCAANFPQPVSEEDQRTIDCLVDTIHKVNCPPLPHIVYRSGTGERDILRHVFHWDLTHYHEVFRNGFQARRPQQGGTPNEVYYNLEHYVLNHDGSRPPLDDYRLPATHAFISTTLNTDWLPNLDDVTSETEIEVYRYEIYAPGGIWVAQTLGDTYPAQDEVCFVIGIAPQYIRSAQRFRLTVTAGTRSTRRARVDNILVLNGNFNPQSHPSRLLNIQRPIFDYKDPAIGRKAHLIISIDRPPPVSEREVSIDSATTNWYAGDVANYESYINAAFSSSRKNEAYLFMMNEYVVLNYAPGTTDDKVVKGPLFICDGYRSLTGTGFAEHGIDSAFGSHFGDEAFIFSGNLCAQINYASGTTNDKIIKGPMTIASMFPLFKGTVFESGVDAAFEATNKGEAYLFKDNQYALINYTSDDFKLIEVRCITQGFPSLKNTIFESGIDAAFASHRTDEAYIFKGDSYALINFAPGTTDDYIIGGSVRKILPNWPSLTNILPRKNRGLDTHYHPKLDPTCSKPPQKLSCCSSCTIV